MKLHIEPLGPGHDCSQFACGNDWLDRYIRKHAIRNQELGYGRTYLATSGDGLPRVEGYYTLSMGCVAFEHLPAMLADRVPRYPMPVAHVGCLAVRSDRQRQGIGGFLLIDALRRILTASEIVAARAIEVQAIDEAARDWYAGYGFTPFANAPLRLFLTLSTARSIVVESGK